LSWPSSRNNVASSPSLAENIMLSDGFIQQLVRRDLLPADEISETYCVVACHIP
jgi:hypothetical protein